jgi:hypothetical protein
MTKPRPLAVDRKNAKSAKKMFVRQRNKNCKSLSQTTAGQMGFTLRHHVPLSEKNRYNHKQQPNNI